MKQHYKLFSLFLFISTLCFSQQMPLDFSDSNDEFEGFNGTSFAIRQDPQNATNQVGEFGNNGGNTNQGAFIDLIREIDLDQGKIINIRFFAFDPNSHDIKIKLEQGLNPDVEVEINVPSGSAQVWKNLTFDFSNAQLTSNGTPINATGTYNRLTVFIDFNTNTAGTYLIDDIDDGSIPTDPNELDVIYTDLVWEDEFDGSGAIDSNKWHHQTFGPNGGQWYNEELQHYTDSQTNSFVSGGFLNIVARREKKTQNGVELDFTSARLNSKYAFTYGRVDVKAKLPFGNGTWPAIWTLGKNISEPGAWFETQGLGTTLWPACGEIDIMEHGLGALNHVSSALHTTSSSGATENFQSYTLNDVANEFHVYSMNWSPGQITFLIDNIGFYTYRKPTSGFEDDNNDGIDDRWPFFEDQFILLNIAMGGIAGAIDAGFTESSMVIDYVKVYQNTTASIDDVFASKFSVYPNPSTDIINIRTDETLDKTELYNTLGQLILNKDRNTKQLNIYSIKSGIYLLKIYSGNKTVTKKVIIE